MWWDTLGFQLRWHGDHFEQRLESVLTAELPKYSHLWIRYVVPLTNRIDSRISQLDPEWIMLRRDLPRLLDIFAESHYSTAFYYCRAGTLMGLVPEMPESIFAVLRMSSYNLFRLLKTCDKLFEILGYPTSCFVQLADNSHIWKTLILYRDLLLKNPVPGRARHIESNSLPQESISREILDRKPKDNKTFTWQDAQELRDGDFMSATKLAAECRMNWRKELDRVWTDIDKLLVPYREDLALLNYMRLDSTAHVAGDTGVVKLYLDVSAPPAPSGTN